MFSELICTLVHHCSAAIYAAFKIDVISLAVQVSLIKRAYRLIMRIFLCFCCCRSIWLEDLAAVNHGSMLSEVLSLLGGDWLLELLWHAVSSWSLWNRGFAADGDWRWSPVIPSRRGLSCQASSRSRKLDWRGFARLWFTCKFSLPAPFGGLAQNMS